MSQLVVFAIPNTMVICACNPSTERESREDQKFNDTIGYISSLRLAWNSWDPVLKSTNPSINNSKKYNMCHSEYCDENLCHSAPFTRDKNYPFVWCSHTACYLPIGHFVAPPPLHHYSPDHCACAQLLLFYLIMAAKCPAGMLTAWLCQREAAKWKVESS